MFCTYASAQNLQQIVPIDSEIYQAIKALYIAQGLALPSTAGPWSKDELLAMLDRLDVSRLSGSSLNSYDFVLDNVKPSDKAFKFKGDATLQMFAHTNPAQFISQDLYMRHQNRTEPLLNLNFDFFLTDYSYGHFEFPIMFSLFGDNAAAPQHTVTIPQSLSHSTHSIGLNIPFLVESARSLNSSFPYRTLVSAGGTKWNVQIGRDRLSWGPGESGNFMVGDHVHYHTGGRITFYGNHLKYMYNVSSFAYPGEYYLFDGDTGIINGWVPSTGATYADGSPLEHVPERNRLKGLNLFIAHRLEWRAFKHKLGFALNESVIYQTHDGVINPDVLLPSMMLHNLFRSDNQNSLLTVEADFSPIPFLNLYGQLAVDEFHVPVENKPESAELASQNTIAFMLGAKTAIPLFFKGIFSASLEYVQASPYMYVHTSEPGGPMTYIVANRYVNGLSDYAYPEEFLGYRWGGDVRVFNIHAEYRQFGAWNIGLNLLLMTHGTHDKWTAYSGVYTADSEYFPKDVAITEDHKNVENYADSTAGGTRNAAYHLKALSFIGSYNFLSHFNLFGQLDFVFVNNFANIAGQNEFDFQATLGIKYSF
jgi:hypothetical protein